MPASFFAPASVMLFPSRNSLPIWGLWVPKVTRGPLKRWHALTAWHHSLTQPNHGSTLVEISVARDLPYDLHQINTRLTPESASLTLQHPTDPLRLWRIRVERRGGCHRLLPGRRVANSLWPFREATFSQRVGVAPARSKVHSTSTCSSRSMRFRR
jgi:hypothetical protein